MHDRTRLEDELSPEELAELEHEAELALQEPTDHEKLRAWHLTEQVFHGDWSVIGLCLALLLAVAGTWAMEAHAEDTRTVTRTINARPYTWTLPEAGCALIRGWEDGSAQAWCPSGLLTYDPDGSADREAGVWYTTDYSG